MKTAVKWLEEELGRRQGIIDSEPEGLVKQTMYSNLYLDLFEKAKEMEREQMHNILMWYQSKSQEYRNDTLLVDAVNDYYETTFKK